VLGVVKKVLGSLLTIRLLTSSTTRWATSRAKPISWVDHHHRSLPSAARPFITSSTSDISGSRALVAHRQRRMVAPCRGRQSPPAAAAAARAALDNCWPGSGCRRARAGGAALHFAARRLRTAPALGRGFCSHGEMGKQVELLKDPAGFAADQIDVGRFGLERAVPSIAIDPILDSSRH